MLLTLLVVLLTGVVAANLLGNKLVTLWERLLARIPLVRSIYSSVKQVMETIFTNGKSFSKVVLVEYPRRDAWTLALLVRAAFYGDPVAIALHQLGNGAVLLFAFFMITDPRTTPATRTGRVLFALAVAAAGAAIGFGLYRADALILALAACGPLVPLLNARFPARRRPRRQH